MGRPLTLSTLVVTAWNRVLTTLGPKCPYRVGDAVVGDDPFNGRREGIVNVSFNLTQEKCTLAPATRADLRPDMGVSTAQAESR